MYTLLDDVNNNETGLVVALNCTFIKHNLLVGYQDLCENMLSIT